MCVYVCVVCMCVYVCVCVRVYQAYRLGSSVCTLVQRRTKGGKVKGDEDDLIGAGHPPRAREDGGGGGGGGGGGDVQVFGSLL